ncbi:type II secretion system F family protein [Methanobrevibacter arboriphilus]|uniref:type II secretion system F family protein n=1 Tax=Methanobrevibacter arboriphilus TaxID=39441 RepID=UPI001CDB1AF7|nr:type II secretion system F family protein [Methanobrevibacter arboriphilus]
MKLKKTGGNLADIIENVSDDLRELNALKRDRKSSVMMAVIFFSDFCCYRCSICSGYDWNLFFFYDKSW